MSPIESYEDPAPLIVSRETLDRLKVYCELVERWSTTTRLLAKGDRSNLMNRHIADSLSLVPLIGPATVIADLGSGAGLPGLIIALATGQHVTLIEANKRKAAFLREAVRVTGAPATVLAVRIEAMSEVFDLITARAVAPLDDLISLVAGRLMPRGRCLFMKGRTYEAELDQAASRWSFDVTCHLSATSSDGRILEISALRARQPC